jgi:hypothetical protein
MQNTAFLFSVNGGITMSYLTQEQISRARQVDVLDYILANEPDNIKRVGSSYRLKDHDSLAVSRGKFFWHSRGIGGRTALNYLINVRGYGFVEAVYKLLDEKTPEQSIIQNVKSQAERLPFSPPLRNKDNKRVTAYLQSRGIDKELILDCIDNGILYESLPYHSAVFIGKDEHGKARSAAIRSTTSSFKRDADGSDKKYAFVLPPSDPNTRETAVFESAIDCCSHFTLCKQGFISPFSGWRISLDGTAVLPLEHFLKTHTKVTHCIICTDSDEAGESAAAKIAKLPGISSERSPPIFGKDYNEMLLEMQKTERTKNQPRQNDLPYL